MTLEELSKIYIKELTQIVSLIKLGENICLTSLPGGGKTMLVNMILDENIRNKFLKDNSLKYKFVNLNAYKDQSELENIFAEAIKNPLESPITKDILKYEFTYLIIEDFNAKAPYTKLVGKLRDVFGRKISFIVTTLPSTNIDIQNIKDFYFLFNNIVKIAYLSETNIETYIEYVGNHFEIKFSKEDAAHIKTFAGGCPKIIKAIARGISKNQTLQNTFTSQELNLLLKVLWNEFSIEDKSAIKKSLLVKKIDTLLLEKLAQLKENNLYINNQLPQWLSLVITQDSLQISNSKEILINNIDVSKNFSKTEKAIIEKLANNKFITREEINILSNKELTDWSIDQKISRVRAKLVEMGFKKDIIKTVKGKGYKLSLHQ